MNNNLVSIQKIKKIVKQKGLMKFIKDVNYSNVQNKKYYVITIDNKKVNFGDIRYSDWLTHHDKIRRENFRKRFKSLFEKNKDNYNTPIFYSYQILW